MPVSSSSNFWRCLLRRVISLKMRGGMWSRPVWLALSPRSRSGYFWTTCSQNLSCHQVSFFCCPRSLGTQAAVCGQRNKRKVHMGRFLVHMHHGGDDRFSGLVLLEEAEHFFKVAPDFGQLLAFEKLRRSGEQNLHHPDAVCSGTASGSLDLILGLCPIPAGWARSGGSCTCCGSGQYQGAGVLFFSTLVVGFDVGYLRPLVLGEAHDGILWLAQGRPSFLAIQIILVTGIVQTPFFWMDELRLQKWCWTKCPAPTKLKSSVHFDHLIIDTSSFISWSK